MDPGRYRLEAGQVRRTCPPEVFSFATTEEVEPLDQFIGQERAVRAMEFGLGLRKAGYNIFITGVVGSGRSTYAQKLARGRASQEPTPSDWCYVHNFHQPDEPWALELPPGQGPLFRDRMQRLVREVQAEVPRTFSGVAYDRQKDAILEEVQDATQERVRRLEAEARAQGFAIRRTPAGYVTLPLDASGEPLDQEAYERLPAEAKRGYEQRNKLVQAQMQQVIREVRRLEREARERVALLDRQVGLLIVQPLVEELKEAYAGLPKMLRYLDAVQEDLIAHLDLFVDGDGTSGSTGDGQARQASPSLNRYEVNLLVTHPEERGAPVVVESNPTQPNLTGKLEYEGRMGSFATDFRMIKAGALHRANGGYLIAQAEDLLRAPHAWEALKRALRTGEVRVEEPGEPFRMVATRSLQPEPVPLRVKVILIGLPLTYHLLAQQDQEFRKLFKIRADFDVSMPLTDGNLQKYAAFVSSYCRAQGLRHLEREAVCRVVEQSCRLVGDQTRLSTRFNEVTEILTEADAWAAADGDPLVRARHVERAVAEKVYRSNRVEERLRDVILEGTLRIELAGRVIGQVNGIAVHDLGEHRFGRPTRISCRVWMGEEGVLDIEREAKLSGRSHSKGVLILSGFVGGRYARRFPFALSARLAFEQSYEEVDGDSASSAETYALLSALSGLPLRQDLAVTGSVDQHGRIQPVGGVTEKVEGFYDLCLAAGLTGEQGVILPLRNVQHLTLRPDVAGAVQAGRFHLYAIDHVDQGLELLTGVPAGERDGTGRFPEGSVNARVEERLEAHARTMLQTGRPASRR
ncbi:Lon protease family protein [Limnochorda pilosa]|uniref:endopeptidase La n=1 Tax=Limnochorda pilosa TaxID=1555112 RepID=A0A0K2SPV5_LIMPI|nr:ATP-binding protein [Limnochorda pilosa]BAS29047.1 ATP-dependent protease [Limnochorda pilosa]